MLELSLSFPPHGVLSIVLETDYHILIKIQPKIIEQKYLPIRIILCNI